MENPLKIFIKKNFEKKKKKSMAVGSPTAPILRSSGSPSVPTPSLIPLAPNGAGLPMAPPTVDAVGSPTAPSLQSSGSPMVPSPILHVLAPLGAGLPTAPPTVHAEGSPTAPSLRSSGSPMVPSPPPPPPWSVHLPSHTRTVICGMCLAGCHGLQFRMCYACCTARGNPC